MIGNIFTGYLRLLPGMILMQSCLALASGSPQQITHSNQRITIEYDAAMNQAERKMVHQWLQQVSNALRTVYGEFPRDEFTVRIEKSRSDNGPVPWGHVERGEPVSVLLVVNPSYGPERLLGDWTAFHEFSHLLIPYRGFGDVWLSEGLATYYQNVIQARSGLLDEAGMWQKISDGFDRGLREQRWNSLSLAEVSNRLGETRQYMRIHWSGVLFWLSADVELRQRGIGTLDNALQQLKACCEQQVLSASDIVHQLDKLMNTKLFVPLFREYRESHGMPDPAPLLSKLGIDKQGPDSKIILNNSSPLASIRRQINQR